MTFEVRTVVIVLAAFAAASLLATSLVPLAVRRAGRRGVRQRSAAMFRARLLPVSAGLAAATLALAACLFFEQRGRESVGLVLTSLAATAAWLAAAGAVRALRTLLATRAAVNRWMRTAEPITLPRFAAPAFAIDADFPIVAVVGVLRPRLVIARSVLAACTEAELLAILAHEAHHLEARDNLRRATLVALPDLIAVLPAAGRLLARWRDAGEDAADAAVDRLGPEARTLLAQALVRVARLAPAGDVAPLPASALYRGGSLERRVRQLLDAGPDDAPPVRRFAPAVAITLVAGALMALDSVHDVVEYAVTRLP